ncbi:MAG: M20 family metallopeptidase [Planctomycetes bacterium]|nr:M20 family metallopeptidase [Planctomycetota bacterium]
MKELLKKLINAESTLEKGELASAEVVSDEFSKSGINCRIDTWDQTRANIIAQINSVGSKNALLFACHLDVVGPGEEKWDKPAFEAIESNGKIYGRGSVDMKGGTAVAVTAIRQIVDSGTKLQGDIIFTAVAGEETDSCGAKRFINDHNRLPDFAGIVIPEPTNFSIVTAHRGMFWLEITTKGKAAHGSTPQLGVNAINSMRLVLNELENYEIPAKPHKLLGKCSMSVNTITGGKTLNVVPDKCKIKVDIRTLPEQNHSDIISDLEKIFAKIKTVNSQFDAEVGVVRQVRPLETDCNCEFMKNFCSAVGINETVAVGFTTDGPHFAPLGAPVVIFGPGKPHLCHKPNEYIELNDMEKAVEHYKNIILEFLS